MTAVVGVLGMTQQLALRKLDQRGERVLMQLKSIAARDVGAECRCAISDLHDRHCFTPIRKARYTARGLRPTRVEKYS